jgi:LAO/AO transport system kinase
MEGLSRDPRAFIRPSPSGGTLGGVARKTRESMLVFEAAGFDVLLVETVGVGQSEITVRSMVDFFLLIMLAGAGDELQGIKRGIMEMADALVINKADGSNVEKARRAQAEYASALHLFPPSPSGWTVRVKTCSSLYNTGIDEIWETAEEYLEHVTENGSFEMRRREQASYWMYETLREGIYDLAFNNPRMQEALEQHEKAIREGKMTSFMAASSLLEKYKSMHQL